MSLSARVRVMCCVAFACACVCVCVWVCGCVFARTGQAERVVCAPNHNTGMADAKP